MIGQRVRFSERSRGMVVGMVIAENEECVAVRLDKTPEVPYIIRKVLVGVIFE